MLAASKFDLARQFDAFATSWDARCGPDSKHGWEFAARVRYLRGLCANFKRPRVLDLGCATGQTLLHLSDLIAAGVGVDISPLMILQARRNVARQYLRFVIDDAAEFCTKSPEQFDLILLIGVLAHLPNQAATLAAAVRVLSRQGRLVLISPHPWNPWFLCSRLIGVPQSPPAYHLSPFALQKLATGAGLKLSELRALPFRPWSNLPGGYKATQSKRGVDRFVGIVQGAFAAQFCHAVEHQRNQ
jgi:SAM-dependent methyltransferase